MQSTFISSALLSLVTSRPAEITSMEDGCKPALHTGDRQTTANFLNMKDSCGAQYAL